MPEFVSSQHAAFQRQKVATRMEHRSVGISNNLCHTVLTQVGRNGILCVVHVHGPRAASKKQMVHARDHIQLALTAFARTSTSSVGL